MGDCIVSRASRMLSFGGVRGAVCVACEASLIGARWWISLRLSTLRRSGCFGIVPKQNGNEVSKTFRCRCRCRCRCRPLHDTRKLGSASARWFRLGLPRWRDWLCIRRCDGVAWMERQRNPGKGSSTPLIQGAAQTPDSALLHPGYEDRRIGDGAETTETTSVHFGSLVDFAALIYPTI